MIQQSENRLADRARGCILAGAIGDAMGGPFEGQPGPLQFRDHNSWKISDDTQLTLATCESIIEIGKVSPEHIAGRFVQWFRERRITGMGASTLKALRDLDAGLHWALAGAKGEMSAGMGPRCELLHWHSISIRNLNRIGKRCVMFVESLTTTNRRMSVRAL